MAEIENEGVAQWNGFLVETRIIDQTIKKLGVGIKCAGEVSGYFCSFIVFSAVFQRGGSA